ncbi:MAG TPA: hypothetical protein VJ505_04595 [Holophagaceae bacterium]|nr:hypothetical protein [Holophagaceae bacterium]
MFPATNSPWEEIQPVKPGDTTAYLGDVAERLAAIAECKRIAMLSAVTEAKGVLDQIREQSANLE